jgi:hypothetical protein
MADNNAKHNMLTDEVPDPNQELFVQPLRAFQSRLVPFLDPNTNKGSDNISIIKRLELRITPRDWECRHYRSYMSPTFNRCASLLQMFSSLQELSIRIRAKESRSKILRVQAKENKLEKFFEECLPERAKENPSSNVSEVVVLVE